MIWSSFQREKKLSLDKVQPKVQNFKTSKVALACIEQGEPQPLRVLSIPDRSHKILRFKIKLRTNIDKMDMSEFRPRAHTFDHVSPWLPDHDPSARGQGHSASSSYSGRPFPSMTLEPPAKRSHLSDPLAWPALQPKKETTIEEPSEVRVCNKVVAKCAVTNINLSSSQFCRY